MSEMALRKRSDGWWIINVPDSVTEYGPYDTKAEADEDRRGLAKTFKMLDADPKTLGRSSVDSRDGKSGGVLT